MKFLTDEANILDSEIQEVLCESTGKTVKNYFIKGVFSTPGQQNRNGRVYPLNIWETEVEKYRESIKNNSVNTLGEWEHPSRTSVDPLQAVMKMVEIEMKEGIVVGKAKILNNNSDKTNQLKSLIDEGMKIGVSSRGVGSVKNGIVESYKLITWDAVAFPSDYNSNLEGITESLNESVGDKEFTIDENDNIVELTEDAKCEKECSLYQQKDIENAIKSVFGKILSETVELNESDESKKEISNLLDLCEEAEKIILGKKMLAFRVDDMKSHNEMKKLITSLINVLENSLHKI